MHLLLVLCLFSLLSVSLCQFTGNRRPPPCAQFCRFRLCSSRNGQPLLTPPGAFTLLSAPNLAATPFICHPRIKIGRVLQVSEAQIHTSMSTFTPISMYRAPNVSATLRFKSDYFMVNDLPYRPASGIVRRGAGPRLRRLAHDLCGYLPIKRYELINANGLTRKSVETKGERGDCVAFRTTAPGLYVELIWDGTDDLDLSLIEPGNELLNFRTPNLISKSGGKLDVDKRGGCGSKEVTGKERIVYMPGRERVGRYVVRVTHFNNCGRGGAAWRLIVVRDGVLQKTEFGWSDARNKEIIHASTFDVM